MSSPPALFLFIFGLLIKLYGAFPLGSRMPLETRAGAYGTMVHPLSENPVAWTIDAKNSLSRDSLGRDSPPPALAFINKTLRHDGAMPDLDNLAHADTIELLAMHEDYYDQGED